MQALICMLIVLTELHSSLGAVGSQCTAGADCGVNEQCIKLGDCPTGTCTCQPNFYNYGTPLSCKAPGPKKLGETCSAVEDCYSFALLTGFIVECATTCNCKTGFTRSGTTDYCLSSATLPTYAMKDQACSATVMCMPGLNLICGATSNTCDCPTDTEWAPVYPGPVTNVCLHKDANPNRIAVGGDCTPRGDLTFFTSPAKVCTTALNCYTCPGEIGNKCRDPLPSIVGTGGPGNPDQTGPTDATNMPGDVKTTYKPPMPGWVNAATSLSVTVATFFVVLLGLL